MSKRLGKFGLLCLEGVAVSIALLAGLAGFAHWKVSHGGLSLDLLNPLITASIEERLAEGNAISIGTILVKRDAQDVEGGGPIRLLTEDLEVTGADGKAILQFPELTFELSTQDILRGNLQPRFVEVSDAALSVTRKKDGTYDLGFTQSGTRGDKNLLTGILGKQGASPSLFEGAVLKNLTFEYIDQLSGDDWLTTNTEARLARTETGYVAELNAPFRMNDTIADLQLSATMDDGTEEVSIELTTETAPVSELLGLVAGPEMAKMFDADLSGNVEAIVDYTGAMKSAKIDVVANEGSVNFEGNTVPFGLVALQADYQPDTRRFDISRLEYDIKGNKGLVAGFVSLGTIREQQSLKPDVIEFSLDAENVIVDVPGFFAEALPLKTASASGSLDLPEKILQLEEINVDYFGRVLSGNADILLPEEKGQSVGVVAAAKIDGAVTRKEILRGWPLSVATGVRDWIESSLPEATARDIDFVMDMPRGAILPGQGLKDDYMRLTFSVSDAKAFYVPDMTPLTGVSGKGVVTGNSFNLKTKGGRIGTVEIPSGEVDMPAFLPRRGPGYYRAQIKGEVREILSVINEEPLRFIERGGFTPEAFSGEGTFSVDIMRPMRAVATLDMYTFNGEGLFEKTTVENITDGYDLTDGSGKVVLKTDGMEVTGNATLEGAPLEFVWARDFDEIAKTEISATGIIDDFAADNFGFSVRQFLRGKVGYEVNLLQENGDYKSARLQLDVENAELNFDEVGWTKDKGEAGQLEVSVLFPEGAGEESFWHFDKINLNTEGLAIIGDVYLTRGGKFLQATLERFYIEDRADLRASLARVKDTLNIDVTGIYANLDIFSSLLQPGDDEEGGSTPIPGSTALDINLGRFDMKQGVRLLDFRATMAHDGTRMKSALLSGNINEGGNVSVSLNERGEEEISRQLEASTDNLGSLLRGFFGIDSVDGGVASYSASELTNGPFAGTLTAQDFSIANTPLIARIFSAGSLTGLNDLLAGDGIEIENVIADLQFEDGVLGIVDARATGPSVGVSVGGDVDFFLDSFDVSGAFAPAYQVNSVLGQLPGIGDLLVSRRGEGVVAFSYQIAGPVVEPTVTVNALSLLTPGIFRRVFEPSRVSRKSTADLLDEAVQAAELARQREVTASAEQLQDMEENIDNIGLPDEPEELEIPDL